MTGSLADSVPRRIRRLRLAGLTMLILLGVIVPFLLFGSSIEAGVMQALSRAGSEPYVAAITIILVLAADIVLPVPSSIVGAFAGAALGLVGGTLTNWIGLMLGSVLGYWLGRAIPAPLADATSTPRFVRFTGPIALAATRAVPVLAEAGIIAAGVARMDFRHVLLIVAPANLAVAFAYAGAGTLLAGIDPALAAILATCLCAAAWLVSLFARRWRAKS